MKPRVEVSSFGNLPDGTPVQLFTLINSAGLIAKIMNYGTIITELHVPDRSGNNGDVVLGFDNLAQYPKGPSLFRVHRRSSGQPHCQRPFHPGWQNPHPCDQ